MTEARVIELAAKKTAGTLTEEEKSEVQESVANLRILATSCTGKGDAIAAECDAAKEVAESASIVTQALSVIEASREQFKGLVKDFGDMQRKYVEDLRIMRMSSIKELSESRRELADIRRFFLDPEHAVEVDKLKEFVEVCERMKALKDSGFLDTIADTILKLS